MKQKKRAQKGRQAIWLLSTLLAGSATFPVLAQSTETERPVFRFKVPVENKVQIPEWLVLSSQSTLWENSGSISGCGPWSPDPLTVDWGTSFQQSRICQQPQVRQVTQLLSNPVTKETKAGDTVQEERLLPVADYQPEIGARDYITGERADEWLVWSNTGAQYGCTVWDPLASTVRLYDPFTQERECQQDQTRSRNVYHVWASGNETPKRVDTESQTLTLSQSQPAVGTRDEIDGQRFDRFSAWVDDGVAYNCGNWSPSPTTETASYTQQRDCQVDQTRTQDVYDVWVSGKETLNRTETEQQTVTLNEERVNTMAGLVYGEWSRYANDGEMTCTGFMPSVGTQTESFTQQQTCEQPQIRTRDVFYSWAYGQDTFRETERESAVDQRTESRTVDVTSSPWRDVGAHSHTAYAPEAGMQTSDYSQTRNYIIDREREWSYTSAGQTLSTRTEQDTQAQSESRNVTVTWSGWVNDGAVVCGEWTTYSDTQESRSCTQPQTGTYTHQFGNESDFVRTVSQNNTYVDIRDVVVIDEVVTYSDWVVIGTRCGTWSPSADDYYVFESISQTQECTEQISREKTTTTTFSNGTQDVVVVTENSVRDGEDVTRTVSGTKPDEVVSTELRADPPQETPGAFEIYEYTIVDGEVISRVDYCMANRGRDYVGYMDYRITTLVETSYYLWNIFASGTEEKQATPESVTSEERVDVYPGGPVYSTC